MESKEQAIEELLTRSVDTIYPSKAALKKRLLEGKPLRVYVGIDPTADYVHLGHATNYLLLERLHQLGHKIIVLVGDFTAMVGDPSDKTAARRQLTETEIKHNLKSYKDQIGKLLPFNDTKNPIEFRFNSDWLAKLTFTELVDLASNFTVQQMIERDTFQKRLAEQKPLFVHEFFYPLMQGYDSVMLEADLEIGGTDQTFNMLAGRTLVKRYQNREKFVLTTHLLENPVTGEKLMSKSQGTGVALNEPPEDMYAKVMALPDQATIQCLIDCSRLPMEDIKILETALVNGENPRQVKASLAREIVGMYHGDKAAVEAEESFNRKFRDKEISDDDITYIDADGGNLVDFLVGAGILPSRSEARRVIGQGGVKVNDEVVDEAATIKKSDVVRVGKRRVYKLGGK